MSITSADGNDGTTARRHWAGLLARADAAHLATLIPASLPLYDVLRPAEIGSVMVQGRIGASGAPFNLGEISVTRCSLRLQDGTIGHAYVQGRDRTHALNAALMDALLQTADAELIHQHVLVPLSTREDARRTNRAEKAAATKVEFFTLARGEDQ
jgi:alpha-D-ribose 1-methylphosphonate 5-triphosphate synthase subunit PhnG